MSCPLEKNKTKKQLIQTAVKVTMCVTFRIQEHIYHISSSAVCFHGYSERSLRSSLKGTTSATALSTTTQHIFFIVDACNNLLVFLCIYFDSVFLSDTLYIIYFFIIS